MTDREPIEKMHRIWGGYFYDAYLEPSSRDKGYKPKYQWRVSSWRDIIRVAEAIYPWLAPRRQAQLDAVLAHRPEFPRGELACPDKPFPSLLGYTRHRRQGTPACAICLESNRMYEAGKRTRNADAIRETNREQYVKNREARILAAREYRARKVQDLKPPTK